MSIIWFLGMPDKVVASNSILDVAQLPKSKMAATQNPSNMKMCITFDRNVVEGRMSCLLWGFQVCPTQWWGPKAF